MRIILVARSSAGSGLDAGALRDALEGAGHRVDHVQRAPLDGVGDAELLVAAGGDGTVRRVALAARRVGLPMAILPFGTANNIGKSLEIVGDLMPVVEGWSNAAPQPFDLGHVSAPWGEQRFVESFGGGVFAEPLAHAQRVEDSPLLLSRETDRSLHLIADLLHQAPTARWAVEADGTRLDGDYLGVEVLNIRFAGPNVPLAPRADTGDGHLDLVLVRPADRDPLEDYLRGRVRLASATIPELQVVPVESVTLRIPEGTCLHLDDELWPEEPLREPCEVSVGVEAGAVRIVR